MCFDDCLCAACVGAGVTASPHDFDRALGMVPLPKPKPEPVKPGEIPARALRYGPGTAPLIPHE